MGIWVGRYAVSGGEVLEHGPWLVERKRVQEDESVRLLVLAEPVDARSSEFCREVADAVASLFRRESLSLTGGLLRALRQAHANLAEWNRRSLREHRVAVGITCVAIRNGEATVAQVGPTTLYVCHEGEVRKLATDDTPAAAPLGGSQQIEPQFTRVALADSQLLLLTSSVESLVGLEGVREALSAGPERALAELFVRTRDLSDMTAVLVADLPGVEEDTTSDPMIEVETPLAEPQPARRVDSGRDQPVAARPRAATSVRRPSSSSGVRSTPLGALGALRSRTLALLAGAAIAIVLLGWVALPKLLSEDRNARLEDAIAAIEQSLQTAAVATDPARARIALETAQEELAGARATSSADERLGALDQRIQSALGALDRVVEVTDLRGVLPFEGRLTAPLRPAYLAAGGGRLWMLDAERGRVFAIDPAAPTNPQEAYRAGERYGESIATEPLAVAWDDDGDRLLVLDRDRALWAIAVDAQPARLALRDAVELRSVTALAVYAGNLYILDALGGEVWRYLPAGDGYDSERNGLLGGSALENGQALVVDGDIFVQDAAALRHFKLGTEQPALLQGIDRAPEFPVGLTEDIARGRLYVGDRGGSRILVADRGGAFVAQLHHESFFDLRGLALSADGTTLYALTGNAIYALDPLATP